MSMKRLLTLAAASATAFLGCSEESHTNSWQEEGNKSFAEESFKSSSSLSTRLDIDYNDTLLVNDTTNFLIEIASADTVKDEDGNKVVEFGCGEEKALCIDSNSTTVSLFLGEFPAGTRISLGAVSENMEYDTLRIRGEFGNLLKARFATWDSVKHVNSFTNYLLPGDSLYQSNQFVIFEDGFYYVDLKANFDSTSKISVAVEVDTAYYNYIGDSTEIAIGLKDTVRGITVIGHSAKELNIKFASDMGYTITVDAKGEWIMDYGLSEGDKVIAREKMPDSLQGEKYAGKDSLGQQLLLPQDSTEWTLNLKPLNIENYLSGPYTTFEVITNSRKLGKGEYLANPDSIFRPGDMDTVIREQNSEARYYLRQEQYIWLADMKKGDSIDINHTMRGYSANKRYIAIINKNGDSLGTINSYNTKFTAPKDGPVYLHYLSTCSADDNTCGNTDRDNVNDELFFYTRISYFNSLKSITFYNSTDESILDTTSVKAGETVSLSKFKFRTLPSTASTGVRWIIPCVDMVPHEEDGRMTTPVFSIQNVDCKDGNGDAIFDGEQEFFSTKLTVQDDAQGESARLIIESLADPLKRDTLTILVE